LSPRGNIWEIFFGGNFVPLVIGTPEVWNQQEHMCISQFLLTGFYFKNDSSIANCSTSVTTTAACCQTCLDTIIIGCCQGEDTFYCHSSNGNVLFLEKCRIHFFPAPFSQSPPSTQSSVLFCTYIQFFHYSIRCIQWSKKVWQNKSFRSIFCGTELKKIWQEVLIWGTWQECLDLLLRSSVRS